MACIDCGEPMPPTLDAPICGPCGRIALGLLGSVEKRVDALKQPPRLDSTKTRRSP